MSSVEKQEGSGMRVLRISAFYVVGWLVLDIPMRVVGAG